VSVEPGATLGHYRILEKIGAGGMGEVWLAEDGRLKRRVALKVLPAWTAADPERRQRFEREAQAIAALNHPNIVTIFSVETEGDTPFLTMELVEGKPLSALIPVAGMALERILDLATPLADAVAVAHAQGITHRDLKPDNIMVTPDGTVKVLDFGLAKLQEAPAPEADGETSLPTATLTREGRIMGTAAYMSPEQAEGKAVEPASDVFSLGVILYEMATGRRPFGGETPISTISSILRDDPVPVTEVKTDLPRHLGRIIRRCLAKDPTRRYVTARGVRNELEILREEVEAGVGGEFDDAAPAVMPGGPSYRIPFLASAALLVVAGLALAWVALGRGAAPAGRSAGTVRLTFSHQTYYGGVESFPTLSPDGDFLAYTGEGDDGDVDIFLERVGGSKPINLTEGLAGYSVMPAFSPDGELLAFVRPGEGIFVMGATGESVRRLTGSGFDPAWSPDGGRILYADEGAFDPLSRNDVSALWEVDAAGGEPRKLFDGDAVDPSWSPNGLRIAYWTNYVGASDSGNRDIFTIRPDGTDPVPVTQDADVDWNPVWAPDGGHLYFSSDRGGSMNLWRIPIDEASGRTLGEPEPVTVPARWAGWLSLSARGDRLAYVALDTRSNIMRRPLDPETLAPVGHAEAVTRGALPLSDFELSPDGEQIVLRTDRGQEDLYLVRSDGTGMRKLTDDPLRDRGPSWSPDAERILFYSNRGGRWEVWEMRTDGSDLRQLTRTVGGEAMVWFPRLFPDGKRFLGINAGGTWMLDYPAEGSVPSGSAVPLGVAGDDRTFSGGFPSPDGRYVAAGVIGSPTGVVLDLEENRVLELGREIDDWRRSIAGWLSDGRLVYRSRDGSRIFDPTAGTEEPLDPGLAAGLDGARMVRIAADGRWLYSLEGQAELDIWTARLAE
jgi:Tol biopolymer transport system component